MMEWKVSYDTSKVSNYKKIFHEKSVFFNLPHRVPGWSYGLKAVAEKINRVILSKNIGLRCLYDQFENLTPKNVIFLF